MTVYVDDMEAPLGRMLMCHMIADSSEELLEMADAIGLDRRWIQNAGTPREHLDISKGKRAAAVLRGAVEISQRELAWKVFLREAEANRPADVPRDWIPAVCSVCGRPLVAIGVSPMKLLWLPPGMNDHHDICSECSRERKETAHG